MAAEETLLTALVLLGAGALVGRLSRRSGEASDDAPLVRLSTRGDRGAAELPWTTLRAAIGGGAIALLALAALPVIVSAGLPACEGRGATACTPGEPLGAAAWIILGLAALPLVLGLWDDLRAIGERG
ncbi:MAG: hypothetical protein H6711_06875 [Myxococcales bacterium]|nr:hypothetical protein [Myxococcales bacterium]